MNFRDILRFNSDHYLSFKYFPKDAFISKLLPNTNWNLWNASDMNELDAVPIIIVYINACQHMVISFIGCYISKVQPSVLYFQNSLGYITAIIIIINITISAIIG